MSVNGLFTSTDVWRNGSAESALYLRKGEEDIITSPLNVISQDLSETLTLTVADSGAVEIVGPAKDIMNVSTNGATIVMGDATSTETFLKVTGVSGESQVYDPLYNPIPAVPAPTLLSGTELFNVSTIQLDTSGNGSPVTLAPGAYMVKVDIKFGLNTTSDLNNFSYNIDISGAKFFTNSMREVEFLENPDYPVSVTHFLPVTVSSPVKFNWFVYNNDGTAGDLTLGTDGNITVTAYKLTIPAYP
jgi:hypothetical protein